MARTKQSDTDTETNSGNNIATMADAALTEARVLVDCPHGACNTLVMLDPDTARAGVAARYLDTDPASIAYLKSLLCPANC